MAQPDKGRGYCDKHLESVLVSGYRLVAGSYGGDSSDCNPLKGWKCSRDDCNRHYAPEHGYFAMDFGGRIAAGDLTNKPRCCEHEECWFMFIGEVGSGRGYLCPDATCRMPGPIVSEAVPESVVYAPPPQTQTGNRDQARADFEREVFQEFALAAALKVDEGSIESTQPPYPDVRCSIDGAVQWFELGRISDQRLPEMLNNPPDLERVRSFPIQQKQPLLKIVQAKRSKTYVTDGSAVELLLHFDHQPPDVGALMRQIEEIKADLDSLVGTGRFSRVWLYDGWSKTVLYCHPAPAR